MPPQTSAQKAVIANFVAITGASDRTAAKASLHSYNPEAYRDILFYRTCLVFSSRPIAGSAAWSDACLQRAAVRQFPRASQVGKQGDDREPGDNAGLSDNKLLVGDVLRLSN
ncbi:hypothetical protein F5Y12DRAFT_716152 [Xylaria sp. FL1777]|nr:hypothetical protein F5Y12DRAFT_716152 [Xylaria sp. FL1777]